jgi:hypothetical protein
MNKTLDQARQISAYMKFFSYMFIVSKSYKRKDIYRIIGIPEDTKGGNWDTGYNKYKNDWFLFCNIGTAGRTGHAYNNKFVGDELQWFGKTGSKKDHATIQNLIYPEGKIYIFTRASNRDPFMYAGAGKAKSVEDTSPVKIVWEFVDEAEFRPMVLPEEVLSAQKYSEGATKQISVNVYERNPEARRKCLEHYGTSCYVCGFKFDRVYGKIGNGFIHVHHLKSISEIGQEYEVDPIKDLRPVCPNCHAMLHRKKPAFTIEELKDIIHKAEQI